MLISKLLRPTLVIPTISLFKPCKYNFSEESNEILTNTKARAFYRTTISKINTRSSSGKGIFHEDILQRLAKKANQHDIPLLFEAYYNFVGHFTKISNKTMDNFILTIINLSRRDIANIPYATQKILQLLRHHDYLKYYPHYSITQACAQFIAKYSHDHYYKLLEILQDKLLIKLNKQTVELLFNLSPQWGKFTRTAKIAVFRFNNNILDGMEKEQLLKMISSGILRFESLTITKQSRPLQQFLSQFEQPSIQQALCWLVSEGGLPKCAQILSKLPADDADLHLINQTINKIEEGDESDVRGQLEGLLENTPHAKMFQ